MHELLLTVEQAAERLQLREFTVRTQLKTGRLRGVKRGRVWRIPESALTEPQPKKKAWAKSAEIMAPIYAKSLATGDELTAITTAPGDFHEASQ